MATETGPDSGRVDGWDHGTALQRGRQPAGPPLRLSPCPLYLRVRPGAGLPLRWIAPGDRSPVGTIPPQFLMPERLWEFAPSAEADGRPLSPAEEVIMPDRARPGQGPARFASVPV
jgi:hypothetical protein